MLLSASGFDSYTDRLFTNPCPVMPWFAPAHLPFAIVWKQSQLSETTWDCHFVQDLPRTIRRMSDGGRQGTCKTMQKGSVRALWMLKHVETSVFWNFFWNFFYCTIFELKWFEDRFGSLDSHFGQAWWLHPGCWQCWLQRGCTELKSWWEDRLHVGDSFSSSTLDTFGWSFHYDFQAFWSCDFHQTFAG